MSARAARRTAFAASVVGVLLLAWVLVRALDPAPSGGGEPQARGGGSEVEEELSEQTEERLEALEQANEQGVRWQVRTKAADAGLGRRARRRSGRG